MFALDFMYTYTYSHVFSCFYDHTRYNQTLNDFELHFLINVPPERKFGVKPSGHFPLQELLVNLVSKGHSKP